MRGPWFLVLVFVLVLVAPTPTRAEKPPAPRPIVILVSIDGFRWDYLDLHRPPTLRRLAAEGVHARRMEVVFPSKTFPSHYSLVTGLVPASHGIVANDMFDPEWGAIFRIGAHPSARESRWWDGEPVWHTVERAGLKAGCFFWPGSDAAVAGKHPTLWRHYDHDLPTGERIQTLLTWLALPEGERPDFFTLYFHHVDSAGHDFGPRADETREAVMLVDSAIADLVAGIARLGLQDRVNIVVVSDHGMTEVSHDRIVHIDDFVDPQDVQIDFQGVLAGLRPHDMTPRELRDRFRGRHPRLRAYLAEDLPARFRFFGHRRIPPVILLPDPGWEVATRAAADSWNPATMKGAHGYDPRHRDMGALFLAHGPAMRSRTRLGTVDSLDVYNLVCATLGVEPAPNDGTWRLARRTLRPELAPAAASARRRDPRGV
jgi:predicted AlkP superfamily pyrophosphatase or phosphodiesterase